MIKVSLNTLECDDSRSDAIAKVLNDHLAETVFKVNNNGANSVIKGNKSERLEKIKEFFKYIGE